MALDASIILRGQGVQLDNQLDNANKAQNLRQLAFQNQRMQQEQNDQNTLSSLLKKNVVTDASGRSSLNQQAALSDMYKVNPQKAMAFQEQLKGMDLDKLKRDTEISKQFAWSVTPENYSGYRQKMIELGVMNAEKLPEMYSPEFVKRWQIGTLEGEKQVDMMFKERQLQSDSLNRKESRDERRFLLGQKVEDKKEEKINSDLQKLSKEVSGTQDMLGALDEVETKLGGKVESFKFGENGEVLKDGKKVDLPGASVPGLGRVTFYDERARELKGAASRVFNATLKDRSGGAVTDNELERLRIEFNEGKYNTEKELIDALQRYKRQTLVVLKNREAGFRPEVVNRYTEQGGRTSLTAQAPSIGPQAPNETQVLKTKDIVWE